MDGFPKAVCTEGPHSCLWYQLQEHDRTAGQIYTNALAGVLSKSFRGTINYPDILKHIVCYLFGPEEDLFHEQWTSPSTSPHSDA